METFDHIIIGGGVLGSSIAYHLARDSRDSVLVLERNELAGSASSKAAGLILQATSKPSNTPLVKLTREIVLELEEEIGESIGFHDVGSIRVAASERRVHELKVVEQNALANGIPFKHLNHEEVSDKAKWLKNSSSDRSIFFPSDGYVDPYLLSQAYARAARRMGAHIRTHTAVNDLVLSTSGVVSVRCSTGDVSGGSVIDAAGAWASVLSARAGYPLPMTPTRSHYWVTAPSKAYGGEFPVVLLPDCKAYMRPEVGGMVVGVQERYSATFDARELPDDINSFSPTRGEEHWDVIAEAMEAISRFFPTVLQAEFSSYVSGLSTYTPDGQILLGAVPGVRNLYAAAGCCGNGVALSAGIGSAISALVRNEEPAFDIAPFAPTRFGFVDPFAQEFRDLCAAARAAKSSDVAHSSS
jgi:4-methylaminobutanoate oxidase (formaldehyde-forming)